MRHSRGRIFSTILSILSFCRDTERQRKWANPQKFYTEVSGYFLYLKWLSPNALKEAPGAHTKNIKDEGLQKKKLIRTYHMEIW